MKYDTYTQTGEKTGQAEISDKVFGLEVNSDLVHQVVVSQASNRRQGNAHSKGRAEVRGGGRKPWRQKGTGRSRHGSTRSPLWKGGGVTFGPTNERNYKKIIPANMRKKALLMVLSAKAQKGLLIVLNDFGATKISAKEMSLILNNLPCKDGSVLVALPKMDKNLILSIRNLWQVETSQAKDLNALDLLSFKYLLMPQESVKVIEKTFGK